MALNTQLDFIWYELTTFSGFGLSSLRAATTVTQTVTAFQDKYEICGTCDSSRRISFAQQALSAFGGGSSGNNGAGCFSNTLGKEMPDNACVQSKADGLWYQCSNAAIDRSATGSGWWISLAALRAGCEAANTPGGISLATPHAAREHTDRGCQRDRDRIGVYVEANESGSVSHDRLLSRCGSAVYPIAA